MSNDPPRKRTNDGLRSHSPSVPINGSYYDATTAPSNTASAPSASSCLAGIERLHEETATALEICRVAWEAEKAALETDLKDAKMQADDARMHADRELNAMLSRMAQEKDETRALLRDAVAAIDRANAKTAIAHSELAAVRARAESAEAQILNADARAARAAENALRATEDARRAYQSAHRAAEDARLTRADLVQARDDRKLMAAALYNAVPNAARHHEAALAAQARQAAYAARSREEAGDGEAKEATTATEATNTAQGIVAGTERAGTTGAREHPLQDSDQLSVPSHAPKASGSPHASVSHPVEQHPWPIWPHPSAHNNSHGRMHAFATAPLPRVMSLRGHPYARVRMPADALSVTSMHARRLTPANAPRVAPADASRPTPADAPRYVPPQILYIPPQCQTSPESNQTWHESSHNVDHRSPPQY